MEQFNIAIEYVLSIIGHYSITPQEFDHFSDGLSITKQHVSEDAFVTTFASNVFYIV
jgi:hypothetical protein